MKLPLLAVALSSVAIQGCGILAVGCTTDFRYGVNIVARDADTGEPVRDGLQGTLTDGDHSEEMMVQGDRLVGAGERPGRYTAVVRALGYVSWQQAGIRVQADECHVEQIELEAAMTRSPL